MNIQTVLFDLDGTLIDTNELIIRSFLHTFKRFGLEYSQDEIKSFNGPPLDETFYNIDPNQAEEMIKTYREYNFRYHNQFVKPFPYAVDTVKKIKPNVKIGIVTNKLKKGALLGLEITGLAPFFQTVITLDDVTHAKPHPEPIIKAMKLLDATPETTLMIGDNYHDIEAGHNAGVKTAGVAWSEKGKAFLQKYEPTFMLEDMRELCEIIGV